MSVLDEIVDANRRFAARFTAGDLPAPPARELAVVTCMDARIVPLAVFGLAPGDAHIIRNAGGRVTEDVIRSLLVSIHALGVRAVAVVHHSECGMTKATDEQLATIVTKATGTSPVGIQFHAINDPVGDLCSDVDALAGSPLFVGIEIRGLLYDIATGQLRTVTNPSLSSATMSSTDI